MHVLDQQPPCLPHAHQQRVSSPHRVYATAAKDSREHGGGQQGSGIRGQLQLSAAARVAAPQEPQPLPPRQLVKTEAAPSQNHPPPTGVQELPTPPCVTHPTPIQQTVHCNPNPAQHPTAVMCAAPSPTGHDPSNQPQSPSTSSIIPPALRYSPKGKQLPTPPPSPFQALAGTPASKPWPEPPFVCESQGLHALSLCPEAHPLAPQPPQPDEPIPLAQGAPPVQPLSPAAQSPQPPTQQPPEAAQAEDKHQIPISLSTTPSSMQLTGHQSTAVHQSPEGQQQQAQPLPQPQPQPQQQGAQRTGSSSQQQRSRRPNCLQLLHGSRLLQKPRLPPLSSMPKGLAAGHFARKSQRKGSSWGLKKMGVGRGGMAAGAGGEDEGGSAAYRMAGGDLQQCQSPGSPFDDPWLSWQQSGSLGETGPRSQTGSLHQPMNVEAHVHKSCAPQLLHLQPDQETAAAAATAVAQGPLDAEPSQGLEWLLHVEDTQQLIPQQQELHDSHSQHQQQQEQQQQQQQQGVEGMAGNNDFATPPPLCDLSPPLLDPNLPATNNEPCPTPAAAPAAPPLPGLDRSESLAAVNAAYESMIGRAPSSLCYCAWPPAAEGPPSNPSTARGVEAGAGGAVGQLAGIEGADVGLDRLGLEDAPDVPMLEGFDVCMPDVEQQTLLHGGSQPPRSSMDAVDLPDKSLEVPVPIPGGLQLGHHPNSDLSLLDLGMGLGAEMGDAELAVMGSVGMGHAFSSLDLDQRGRTNKGGPGSIKSGDDLEWGMASVAEEGAERQPQPRLHSATQQSLHLLEAGACAAPPHPLPALAESLPSTMLAAPPPPSCTKPGGIAACGHNGFDIRYKGPQLPRSSSSSPSHDIDSGMQLQSWSSASTSSSPETSRGCAPAGARGGGGRRGTRGRGGRGISRQPRRGRVCQMGGAGSKWGAGGAIGLGGMMSKGRSWGKEGSTSTERVERDWDGPGYEAASGVPAVDGFAGGGGPLSGARTGAALAAAKAMLPRLNGTLPGIFPQTMPTSDMGLAAQMLTAPDVYGLNEKTKGQALGPVATAAAEAFGMGDFDDLDIMDDDENMSFDQHVENLQGILDAACIPPLPVPLRTLMEACCANAKSSKGVVQPTARDLTNHMPPDQRAPAMARIRREKNRQAARKCRSKKIRCTNETEQRLNELRRANRLLQQELFGWQARFAMEGQKRELLKHILHQHWTKDGHQTKVLRQALPAGVHTATDLICGIEAGTLDVQDLLARLQGLQHQLKPTMPIPDSSSPLPPVGIQAKSAEYLPQPAALQSEAKVPQGALLQDFGQGGQLQSATPAAQEDDGQYQLASRGLPIGPLELSTPTAVEAASLAPAEQPAAQLSKLAAAGVHQDTPPPSAQVHAQPPKTAVTPSSSLVAAAAVAEPPSHASQSSPDQPPPALKDPPATKDPSASKDPPAPKDPPASESAAPLDEQKQPSPTIQHPKHVAPQTLKTYSPSPTHKATASCGLTSPPARTTTTSAVPFIPPHLRNTAPGGPSSLNSGIKGPKPREDHHRQYTPAPARARPPPPPPPMVSMPPLSGFSSGAPTPQPAQHTTSPAPLSSTPHHGCSSKPPSANWRSAAQKQQQQQQPGQQKAPALPWPCAQNMFTMPEGGTPAALALMELLELTAQLPGICKEEALHAVPKQEEGSPSCTNGDHSQEQVSLMAKAGGSSSAGHASKATCGLAATPTKSVPTHHPQRAPSQLMGPLELQQSPCRPTHQKRAAAHASCELLPTKRMKQEDN